MLGVPFARVQVASSPQALGRMVQPQTHHTFTMATLLATTSLEKSDLFYEMNTGMLMRRPVPVWRDLGTAETLTSGGNWGEITDRATTAKVMVQRSTAAGDEWWMQTNTGTWIGETEAGFCVRLGLSPAPKDATHDYANWYRIIAWPAEPVEGDVQYRVVIAWGAQPRLEMRTLPESEWTQCGVIPSTVDLSALRSGKPVELTLTVMYLSDNDAGYVLVWLGSEMNRLTLAHRGPFWAYGDLLVEGKNGYCTVGYADLRFAREGYHLLPPRNGPRGYENTSPALYVDPDPAGYADTGMTVTGAVESRDKALREYVYRITLSGPAISAEQPDLSYASNAVKTVTLTWPSVYSNPPQAGWRDVLGFEEITESAAFDWNSGLVTRGFTVTLQNTEGQRARQAGVQAAQVYLGYRHTGTFLRGRGLANFHGEFEGTGAQSHYTFTIRDLMAVLENTWITDDLYPSRWCVYAMVRLLLEHAGLVPGLQQRIPLCKPGPNPPCKHTKIPPHPGWTVGTEVLSCLRELAGLEQAQWGTDPWGQFRFEPFVWNPEKRPAKVFHEGARTDGRYSAKGGSAFDEILSIRRIRDLSEVRNEILLVGWQQEDGRIFAKHYQNPAMLHSQWDPSSPNYLGGLTKRVLHAWNGYATPEIADFVAAKYAQRAALPSEHVLLKVPGQPTLYPTDIIEVWDRRLGLAGCRYFLMSMNSTWRAADGSYYTTLLGTWTGAGRVPGY